jgi:hypothetical protein
MKIKISVVSVLFLCFTSFADEPLITWGDWTSSPVTTKETDVAVALYQHRGSDTLATYVITAYSEHIDSSANFNKIYMGSGKIVDQSLQVSGYKHAYTGGYIGQGEAKTTRISIALDSSTGTSLDGSFLLAVPKQPNEGEWGLLPESVVTPGSFKLRTRGNTFDVSYPTNENFIEKYSSQACYPNSATPLGGDSSGYSYCLYTIFTSTSKDIYYKVGKYKVKKPDVKFPHDEVKVCDSPTDGSSATTLINYKTTKGKQVSKALIVANQFSGETGIWMADSKVSKLENLTCVNKLGTNYYSLAISSIPGTGHVVLVYGHIGGHLMCRIGTYRSDPTMHIHWEKPEESLSKSTNKVTNNARAGCAISADGQYIVVAKMYNKKIYLKVGKINLSNFPNTTITP